MYVCLVSRGARGGWKGAWSEPRKSPKSGGSGEWAERLVEGAERLGVRTSCPDHAASIPPTYNLINTYMHAYTHIYMHTYMHTGPQTWVIKPVTAVDSGPNGPKSMAILGIQPAARAGCVGECHAKIGQNRPSALGSKSGKNSDYVPTSAPTPPPPPTRLN